MNILKYKDIYVSEKIAVSLLYTEDGGSGFFETLLPVYQTSRHHIPESYNLHLLPTLKYVIMYTFCS
jgi:hypothetical protein